MRAIVDADSFAFRTAVAKDDHELNDLISTLDIYINNALDEVGATSYQLYLSGRDNFRYKVFPEYKAQRYKKTRPKWEPALKRHLVDQWNAEVIDGIEGDDACGINHNEKTILIHQDKDLNQLKGWHYNFVKREKYFVTPEEADRYFWYQLLVGDPTDGIKGASGIGKVKAERIIAKVPLDGLYEAVKCYFSCDEELDLNAQCVYIWRKPDDNWKNILPKTCCFNPTIDSNGRVECCQGAN
jgi:5'-3' exonuclease